MKYRVPRKRFSDVPSVFFHGQRSFTLFEVLIYIGVLAIVVVVIAAYLLWAIQANTKVRVMNETLDNARRAMEIMTLEIREAQGIYTPTSIFDTHPGQLSLEMRKYLPPDETKTYMDFYLSDDNSLCFKKEAQPPSCITSEKVEVNNLVFRQITTDTAPSIQIELQVDYRDTTGRPAYQASVKLRSVAALRSYEEVSP